MCDSSLMINLGFPYPDNAALASQLESIVRVNGGVPATIAVFNGVARVGLSAEEMIELAATAQTKSALKVSRRDLGYLCGRVNVFQPGEERD
jgi:pseudouridine-5'-phosphate glycosidase/pseudouridine kinase